MNTDNCIMSTNLTEPQVTPAQWNQTELPQRASGLLREALASQPTHIWRTHRDVGKANPTHPEG